MSLLGVMIAWLVSGLLGRSAPARVRSAIGRETGCTWRSECAWSLVAWQHAIDGLPLFWNWSDLPPGRPVPGSCRLREGSRAVHQWVARR